MAKQVEYYGGPDADWEMVTSKREYTEYTDVPAITKDGHRDTAARLTVWVDEETGLLVADIAKFERWMG